MNISKAIIPLLAIAALTSCNGSKSKQAAEGIMDSISEVQSSEVPVELAEAEETPEYGRIPETANLVGEGVGYEAYLAPSNRTPNDEFDQPVDLWIAEEGGKKAYKLLSSNVPFTDRKLDKPYVSVIEAIDRVNFVCNTDNDKVYVVITGCFDARNEYVWFFPLAAKPKDVIMLPVGEGFLGIDSEANVLKCGSYAYDDNGRYSTIALYDFSGDKVDEYRSEEEY